MKKLNYLLITILIGICFWPLSVLAAGNVSVSTTNLTIVKGSSATFTITASNAAGRIDISTSNAAVASISSSSVFLDMQSSTITVRGNASGTATITVRATDVTTYDDEDISGRTYTINVTVKEPTVTPPSTPTQPTNPVVRPNNGNTQAPVDNRSTNNKIKKLEVTGYELQKIDDHNYTLTVSNNVSKININAVAEDNKATITGNASHNLKVGENNIEVIVTSESGAKNKINIKVTRKDGYYLDDLKTVLQDDSITNKEIIIDEDSKITKDMLQEIKKSKKSVAFNYYDENKQLVYSWIIDGSQLKNTDDLLTTITNDSDSKNDILRLSNYADGLFIGLKQTNNSLSGSKLKLFVGDKYKDNDLVNVYAYKKNNNKLELVNNKIKVENGYIEFEALDASDYFVTMSTIPSSDKVATTTDKSSSTILIIVIGILSLSIIGLIITFIIKKQKNKREDNNNDNNSINNQFGSNTNFDKQTDNITYQYNDTPNNSVQEMNNSTWDNKQN